MDSEEAGRPALRRVPLGRTARRISYERRVRIWLTVLAVPMVVSLGMLMYLRERSWLVSLSTAGVVLLLWWIAAAYFFEQITRPLQTLSNVVAALREDDFSFRARGARRGDSLGDLALEINALAGMLQAQRGSARDALTLVERVMTSMEAPVLAFHADGRLRLLNRAAMTAFGLHGMIGAQAEGVGLGELLKVSDQGVYAGAGTIRWAVRRTTFRLQGVPHTLVVLSDVAAALREEERLAWQRLIRVLSHEINNSLTPIKSLAGSLRTRLPGLVSGDEGGEAASEFQRGLELIEDRAASLNRFLQAYQQLTRLPAPQLQGIDLGELLARVVRLEVRLPVRLDAGPQVRILADADQLQQLLINLVKNAVEAALSADAGHGREPAVGLSWSVGRSQVVVAVQDNGAGLTNPANVFVPFYTTKPDGSGIGLVLAQQIAVGHGGAVTLQNNEDGVGCTAELRLPLREHVD